MNELDRLKDVILEFRDSRNWKQFHNSKDMFLSLVLEATELLEISQWKNGTDLESHLINKKEAVAEELSDILYWLILIAHDLDINLEQAFLRKMEINKKKYPVEKSLNSSKKYKE